MRFRRFASLPLVIPVLSGALWVSAPAYAQTTLPADTPAPLVLPGPSAPNINILLLAIDTLPDPSTPIPAAVMPPPTVAPPLVGEITPASAPLDNTLHPIWQAQAAKKDKKSNDDDLFRLEPDRGLVGSPDLPQTTLPVGPISPLPGDAGATSSVAPAGRAQLVSLPIRRALLGLGWGDVFPTTPDSTTVSRAIGDKRLTPRTFDVLKIALAQLAAPDTKPSAQATKNATVAATRIGQALGYRAVVAFYVSPSTTKDNSQTAAFSFIVADSTLETGEPLLFDEKGSDEASLGEAGASTAAALLDKTLRDWPLTIPADRTNLAKKHFDAAVAMVAVGDNANAQDEINQALALDSTRGDSYVVLGDLLAPTDPVGAANAYRRAVDLNARDGATWAKIAITYTTGTIPDWPRALDAGNKAIAAGYDSVPLRVAMATAQFGRGDLLRKADRLDRADDADFEARKHLDRALELAPDDPTAVRLLARKLVENRRFSEAVQTLDRVAPRYPKDIEIQSQYAAALAGTTGREEDAFAAYSKVWRLSGQKSVDVDAITYRALADGFDLRLFNLGKSAKQLVTGVANAAVPREDALLQLTKLKEDMSDAENAIDILRPPASAGGEAAASRAFAADLMSQSLEAQQIYLETGQEMQRLRGSQLLNQAINRLNAARTGAR